MNQNNRNQNREKGWDEQERDQYSNWHNRNQQQDDNRNRGGFMGSPGTNYGSGAFGGAGYGRGLQEDKYRGYNNSGSMERSFASNYNSKYGADYNDWENHPEWRHDSYYENRRVNQTPKHNDNRGEKTDLQYNNHRGKGPKGYSRSDERILEDVNDRLSDDPYIDASDIDVKVENGIAILSGHVESRDAKKRAENIAESVRGIKDVENRLRIGEGFFANMAKAFTASLGDVTVGHDQGRKE